MKRLFSTLAGMAFMASLTGCCCDWCRPCCSPCASNCAAPCGGAPAAAYISPYGAPAVGYASPVTTTTGLPASYYGAAVATATVPVESLPTY